jgi:DNA-binding transcriptional MerR regulator
MAGDGFTIGEVLNQLKEEFEDITISKIRFLESEGLIYPDRTESGYRKFSPDDVDRLRFVLKAQRDHYLPLKVIRDQLERLDAGDLPSAPVAAPSGDASASTGASNRVVEIAGAVEEAVMRGDSPLLDPAAGHVELDLRELCEATGLDADAVRSLRDFGILGDKGEDLGPFDPEDVLIARAARDLLELGLEPRHLRMYRQFVDREVSLYEQLISPLLHQRNPEARRQATGQLERLAALTGQMKRSLLAKALRGYAHGA